MILVNVPRLVLYICLGVLAYFGQAPWWLAPGMILYDVRWYRMLGWPGAYKKAVDAATKHLQMQLSQNAIDLPGPKNPKGWS